MEQNSNNKYLTSLPQELIMANTVHEIRTPVQTIIGTLDLLSDTQLSPEQLEYIRQIRFGADVLLALVNDILDFSKIKSHKMCIECVPYDVKSLTEQVTHLISIEAFNKGLEIVTDIDHSIENLVLGDPTRIQQVLINLIKNAVKFTEKGYISVKLSKKDDKHLLFTITDSGIGIPEKKQNNLFKTYFQGDPSISRKYGGTGLGLAICKGLVEMMDGEIGVKPNPFGGSIFWFSAGFAQVPDISLEKTNYSLPSETKTLIVDDSKLSQDSLENTLKALGIQNIQKASNAKEAMMYLKYANQIGSPFKIAFIDMHMPIFDGWSLAEEIRNEKTIECPKLYMLVPEGQMGGVVNSKYKDWFSCFVYKPVQKSVLEKVLLESNAENPSDYSELLSPYLSKIEKAEELSLVAKDLKILVCEDHPVNRKILVGFLEQFGAKVYEAENGEIALMQIKNNPDIQLIFMDIQMPEISGIEATIKLRKDKYQGIIIACTANNDKDNFVEYCKIGMNDVLVKPFKRETVKNLLDKWNCVINLPSSGQIAFLDSNIVTNSELWDTEDFEDTIGKDWDLGRQILLDFIEQTKILIENAKNALKKQDFEELHRIAHTIKGSSAAISANKLTVTGEMINQAAKNSNLSSIETHLKDFEEQFELFILVSGKWKHLEQDFRKK